MRARIRNRALATPCTSHPLTICTHTLTATHYTCPHSQHTPSHHSPHTHPLTTHTLTPTHHTRALFCAHVPQTVVNVPVTQCSLVPLLTVTDEPSHLVLHHRHNRASTTCEQTTSTQYKLLLFSVRPSYCHCCRR